MNAAAKRPHCTHTEVGGNRGDDVRGDGGRLRMPGQLIGDFMLSSNRSIRLIKVNFVRLLALNRRGGRVSVLLLLRFRSFIPLKSNTAMLILIDHLSLASPPPPTPPKSIQFADGEAMPTHNNKRRRRNNSTTDRMLIRMRLLLANGKR